MDRTPLPVPRSTRRTALAGGLGLSLLLASGCQDGADTAPPGGSSSPGGRTSSSGSSADPSAAPEPDVDADVALVEQVRRQLAAAAATVATARRRRAPLARDLAPLERLHRAHLDALAGQGRGPGDVASPYRVGARSAGQVLSDVRRREEQLHTSLVQASVRAQSGALGRVLASMSAGLRQHLEVLPQEVSR